MNTPTLELFLIRHAESGKNMQPHLIGGRSNEATLTEVGTEQAKRLGLLLRNNQIFPSRVFSSPAIRTLETARQTLDAMELELELGIDDRLQELDQGDWTGKLRTEIYSPQTIAEIDRLGNDFKAPNGESMNEVGQRMFDWIESIIPANNSQAPEQVLVFTHGIAIKSLAAIVANLSHDQTYQAKTDNTSITLFSLRDGTWQLEYLGKVLE